MTNSPYAIQMAHYALGKLEASQGYQLDWRGRRDFIAKFLLDNPDLNPKLTEKKED